MTFRLLIPVLLGLAFISSCPGAPDVDVPPDAACPAEPPDPLHEIWRGYSGAVWDFAGDNGLTGDWWQWMLANKERYKEAYVRARTDRRVRVEVRYAAPIAYDPPWASEDEHMAALERLAELAYPGWDFSFSLDDDDAEFYAVLGHEGTSYADGDTVYLVWEGIFLHEFAHLLGIGHHYCGADLGAPCPDRPPGEGRCIMDRNAATWGPTEQFVLNLGQQRHDAVVDDAIDDINGRYPHPLRAAAGPSEDPYLAGRR